MNIKAVAATVSQDFSFGTVGGQWRFVVASTDGAGVEQTVDSDALEAEFQLPPGAYGCTLQRLSDSGAPLGPSVSEPFTVEQPAMVSIDVAAGLTITPIP